MTIEVTPHGIASRFAGRDVLADAGALCLVREAVAGRSDAGRTVGIPRPRAVDLLAASGFPNAHRDLERLLGDPSEAGPLRYRAALGLGRIGTPDAAAILLTRLGESDPRVLAGVYRALGMCGGADAIGPIEGGVVEAEGYPLKQARFALRLIAHRIGAVVPYATEPIPAEFLSMSSNATVVRVRPAARSVGERTLVTLGNRPYGIELSERPMYATRCDRCQGIVLLNREYTLMGDVSALFKRPMILGLGALRNDSLRSHQAAVLFLSTPIDERKAALSAHLLNGELVFGGTATLAGSNAKWSLRAVKRLGAFPVSIKGQLVPGDVHIKTAVSGTRIAEKASPSRLRFGRRVPVAPGSTTTGTVAPS